MEQPLREKLYGKPMTLFEKIEKMKQEEGIVDAPTIKVEEEPGSDKIRGDKPITS